MAEEIHKVKILKKSFINHDVMHIETEKPADYNYTPGQATHVRIDKDGWRDEKGAFTFTNLPDEDHLEFTIKSYPSHNGVTERMASLQEGDTLILEEVYGAIEYKGKGVFIAGGAGITPFIAIFKDLVNKSEIDGNTLIFANQEERDIFKRESLEAILGDNFLNILSEEKTEAHAHGRIDLEFLKENIEDFSQYFYLCGPPKMMKEVKKHLFKLGVTEKQIVQEDLD
ncbi:MAG: flavodoxin reductase [Leeuwenhoekiella sp.]